METPSPGNYRLSGGSESRISLQLFGADRNNSGCVHAFSILRAQAARLKSPFFCILVLVTVTMLPQAFGKQHKRRNAPWRPLAATLKGQGFLHADNPAGSHVPHFGITVGSTVIQFVFDAEDTVRSVPIHNLERLPFGLVFGTSFLSRKKTNIPSGQNRGFQLFS